MEGRWKEGRTGKKIKEKLERKKNGSKERKRERKRRIDVLTGDLFQH